MRLKTSLLAALILTFASTAWGQGKADSPSTILGQANPDLARCVKAPGLVRLLLRLDLDGNSRVEKVGIESEADLSRTSRRCLERVAGTLAFGPDLAGMTIEHELQVVNSKRGTR